MLPSAEKVAVDGSYDSAVAVVPEKYEIHPIRVGGQSELSPPLINTEPSGSSVAAWLSRCLDMSEVEMNFSVTGSYSSELANRPQSSCSPPVSSTLPVASRVAVDQQCR